MAAGMIYIGNAQELAAEVRLLSKGAIPTARLARILLAAWCVNERTGEHDVNDTFLEIAESYAPDMEWIGGRRGAGKRSNILTPGGK
jgi:hypothetical protein